MKFILPSKKNFITVLLFTQGILALPNITTNGQLFIDSPLFFQNTCYFLTYLITWNFLFEISLIIVLHYKQNSFYVTEHSFINLMIILIQLINNFFLLKNNEFNFSRTFMIIELFITIFEGIQFALGNILNHKLQSEKLVKGIFIYSFLHKNLGRVIYLATKFQIATYAYFFFQNSHISPIIFISLLFGLTTITHIFLYIIFNANNDTIDNIQSNEYLINKSIRTQEYNDLLKNINGGDIDFNPGSRSFNECLSDMPPQNSNLYLIDENKEIDWVIIEDKVFDITDLRHPKGNYILKSLKYRDITREIYGLKCFRFSEGEYIKILKQTDTQRTFEFLKRHCIGELVQSSVITFGPSERVWNSMSQITSNINLFENKLSVLKEPRKERIFHWSLSHTYLLNESSKIFFLSKQEKDHVVNISSFWLRNFGKYFLITNSKGVHDYYFITISLSPKYLSIREQWHEMLNLSFLKNLEKNMSLAYRHLSHLSASLLQSARIKFNALLNSSEDIRDPFLPLFHFNKDYNKNIINDKGQFGVNGPIGLGIGFGPNSTKKILIVAKDSGILPFVDFFEYIGQRALMELNQLSIPHPIFGKEYLLYYTNEICIWVYWEISEEFLDSAQLLGIFGLKILNAVSKEDKFLQKANQKDKDFTKIVNILQGVNLVSNRPPKVNAKISETNTRAENFQELLDSVAGGNTKLINKVVISGEMEFTNRVLKNSHLSDIQVLLL